jgi:hypothetical protein
MRPILHAVPHVDKLVAIVALVLAGTAHAAPPRQGLLVPGRSLGGVTLGMAGPQVLGQWGRRHGVCRGCARTTWYFNERPFAPRGAGVELRRGRVAAVFTVWRPMGWQTNEGLVLGDVEARITEIYGAMRRVECGGYSALVLRRGGAVTAFYVYDGALWGFGLMRPDVAPCR